MSLQVSRILNQSTQLNTGQGQVVKSDVPIAQNNQGQSAPKELNLAIGSTISGTVEESKDNMVSIKLSNGQTVLAKLEESLAFSKGANVAFSVSGMSDGQYILKSLFTNTAMQATGEKALLQAGIAVNENSLSMVSEMMEDGMPVDKNSLQAMYKEVVSHPQTSGANIVAMNRLQIPITDTNVNQFQAYMNLEHQISEGVTHIADSLVEAYQELSASGEDKAFPMMKELVQLFGQELDEKQLAGMKADVLTNDAPKESDLPHSKEGTISINPDGLQPQMKENVGSEGASYLEALKKIAAMANPEAAESVTEEKQTPQMANDGLQNAKAMTETLRFLGMNEETIQKYLQGNVSDKQLLGFAKELLAQMDSFDGQSFADKLTKLFDQKDFQTALKNEMSKALLLSPQELAQKEDVKAYYDKLNQQLGKLSQSMSQVLPQDSQPMQQLTNMQDNLQFMDQLNQTMSYIQLPMKLLSDKAHGDLYVYTNKKHMADSDGTVSAFLHLDMDHLGPVDVYVTMQEKKVNTNFTLRDDEMIDFIAQRIDQLNERLAQKGYQMTAKITKKEIQTESNVMQEMIEDHKQLPLIGTKSFDMRA